MAERTAYDRFWRNDMECIERAFSVFAPLFAPAPPRRMRMGEKKSGGDTGCLIVWGYLMFLSIMLAPVFAEIVKGAFQ